MSLHPHSKAWLEEFAGAPEVDFSTLTAVDFRAGFGPAIESKSPSPLYTVESRIVRLAESERELRIYYPTDSDKLPVTVFFHGGGFVIGGPDMTDELCRELARSSGGIVVSVDYRLAPENPFPDGLEDAAAAVHYVYQHAEELRCDPNALALAGDSSGGNFVAVLALMSKDGLLPPICHQLLFYPVLDPTCSSPSFEAFATGFLLTTTMMEWYWRQYGDVSELATDWRATPLRRTDLEGVAAATISIAELDPARDDGEAYAHALNRAGVDVELIRWDGQIHGFLLRPDLIDDATTAASAGGLRLRASFEERSDRV